MSVISFDKDGGVWGASSSLIYSMLLYMIRTVGPKEYLLKFKDDYDNMYNSIGLEDITVDQVKEFRSLVVDYIEEREYESLGDDRVTVEAIRLNLDKLVEMIDTSIAQRRACGPNGQSW